MNNGLKTLHANRAVEPGFVNVNKLQFRHRYEFESRVLRGDETFRVTDTVTVQSKPTPQVNRVERECYTKTRTLQTEV